ncbi:twin-arginine translocation signal domain-containing protein [Paraburkholderia sacchari]|uniref:twin-arginine translocation signal domain-containing protein n=1 Tax=Paraburkholderia sacchari TaxID=159450 RepID=UPI001BCD1D20|nr:twin-arginine translocation signal domain-containing protein [Paraburkholderia sacchari]
MKKEGAEFSRRGFIKRSLTAASSAVLLKTSPAVPITDACAAENSTGPAYEAGPARSSPWSWPAKASTS